MGGKFHPKLNMCGRPIANKYREGKMKRTLKRELKVLEIVGREGMAPSFDQGISLRWRRVYFAVIGRQASWHESAGMVAVARRG